MRRYVLLLVTWTLLLAVGLLYGWVAWFLGLAVYAIGFVRGAKTERTGSWS